MLKLLPAVEEKFIILPQFSNCITGKTLLEQRKVPFKFISITKSHSVSSTSTIFLGGFKIPALLINIFIFLLISLSTTFAPFIAKSFATAIPIPLPAPVTIATSLSKLFSLNIIYYIH